VPQDVGTAREMKGTMTKKSLEVEPFWEMTRRTTGVLLTEVLDS
jgi:hypothetical protein